MPRTLGHLPLLLFSLCLMSCTDTPSSTPDDLQKILTTALNDPYAYETLGEMCDTIGHRLNGSDNMHKAVQWTVEKMHAAGFDSVWTEPVTLPLWTRGREWARCTAPVDFDLTITGLGLSDGTGPEPIEAEIIVIGSYDELEARSAEVSGRIVLFDYSWQGYGHGANFRTRGASKAAVHGAVACLVRSVTPNSLNTPHTGVMAYAEDAPRIPAAAVTVEDAARLHRLCDRGLTPTVQLYMEAANHGDTVCHNVVGDIRGQTLPQEIVLLGAHLDSWDLGTCAQDDGAGVVLTMAAARLLLQGAQRPARTIRVVQFTGEEYGGYGGDAYLDAHRHELDRHVLALESDSGSYTPQGFSVRADSLKVLQLRDLATPLADLGDDEWAVKPGWAGVDIGPIVREGVPGVGHRVDGSRYFDVHHSPADTFEKVDPQIMARNVAAIAGLIHLVANKPAPLWSD